MGLTSETTTKETPPSSTSTTATTQAASTSHYPGPPPPTSAPNLAEDPNGYEYLDYDVEFHDERDQVIRAIGDELKLEFMRDGGLMPSPDMIGYELDGSHNNKKYPTIHLWPKKRGAATTGGIGCEGKS